MVSTSNWPPLVAISVVTRWRRTFSSSVTHFTVTSGFLAVNSLVNACMRIMSPLFTVAIVNVVCAIEGAEPNRVAAPSRAPRTCFTVTSLFLRLSICPRIAIMFTSGCNVVKIRSKACTGRCSRQGRPKTGPAARRQPRFPRLEAPNMRSMSLRLQDGACRDLVRDQPVDQTSLQRRPDRRDLGRTDGRSDGQGLGRDLRWNAGETAVCPSVDDASLGIKRPTGQFANGAQPHHFKQFLAADEAVNMDLRALVHLADPDKPQVGFGSDRPHFGDRINPQHLVAFARGRHQKWQRHRIVARLGSIGEPPHRI